MHLPKNCCTVHIFELTSTVLMPVKIYTVLKQIVGPEWVMRLLYKDRTSSSRVFVGSPVESIAKDESFEGDWRQVCSLGKMP